MSQMRRGLKRRRIIITKCIVAILAVDIGDHPPLSQRPLRPRRETTTGCPGTQRPPLPRRPVSRPTTQRPVETPTGPTPRAMDRPGVGRYVGFVPGGVGIRSEPAM